MSANARRGGTFPEGHPGALGTIRRSLPGPVARAATRRGPGQSSEFFAHPFRPTSTATRMGVTSFDAMRRQHDLLHH